jgi:inner membrane protein
MRGHTHSLIGLTTLAAADTLTGLVQDHVVGGIPTGAAVCVGVAILGALAPDVDAGESTIKGELGAAGVMAGVGLHALGVKHRGLTHSGLMTLLVTLASWLIGGQVGYADVGLAFGLGYFSHVMSDALTMSGVPLFWPSSRRFYLLPRRLRLRTSGPVEMLIFILGCAALVWLLPDLVPPQWLTIWVER